jgi:CPA1 family monovalent cation:H+ antiporter
MIAVRMAWVFGETYIAYALRRWAWKVNPEKAEPRSLFVIGWGGMRGVLSLAAAVSLPYSLPGGALFPQRSMIIYLAFCLILATLVIQGLTLPWLIRTLGLSEPRGTTVEEHAAQRVLFQEAIVHLTRMRSKNRGQSAVLNELIAGYQRRMDAIPAEQEDETPAQVNQSERKEAILSALQVEREALIRMRDDGDIDDEVLRSIQRDLDLTESRVHTGSQQIY